MGPSSSPSSSPKDGAARDANTREALLQAAARIFGERGFEGATVKDLADAAGVNVSLVSYYFGGKEGLYRTCLENFGQDRLSTAERVLKKAESAEDFRVRLTMFAEEFLRANLRDRDVCKILHRDIDMGINPVAMEIFKTTFLPLFFTFRSFFASAQESGIMRADLDPMNAAGILFGAMIHAVKSDPIRKEFLKESLTDDQVLERMVKDYITIFIDGSVRKQDE